MGIVHFWNNRDRAVIGNNGTVRVITQCYRYIAEYQHDRYTNDKSKVTCKQCKRRRNFNTF